MQLSSRLVSSNGTKKGSSNLTMMEVTTEEEEDLPQLQPRPQQQQQAASASSAGASKPNSHVTKAAAYVEQARKKVRASKSFRERVFG